MARPVMVGAAMVGSVPTPDTGLRMEGVGFRAGVRYILRDVTGGVPSTGITALIGPNGSGKTTLLRLLHGMLSPAVGRISWPATLGGDATSHRPTTGLLLQSPVLLRRSVRANLRYALRLSGANDTAGEEDRLLHLVGLADQAALPARRLSGGQQQRLALAREIARKPAMFLMDEPARALDPAATAHLEDLIRTLAQAGTPVLFSSHDMRQVRRLADHCLFLHNGQLVSQGVMPALFDKPENTTLNAFLAGELI